MSSFIIGLTGGIGCGKSTVAPLFALRGIAIIDADQIAREIVDTQPAILAQIIAEFGNSIVNEHKQLDRKKLAERIFFNPKERKWLEQVLHPLIRKILEKKSKQAASPYCIQMTPLLTEEQSRNLDRILVIDSSKAQQIKRVLARDQLSLLQINAILKAQPSRKQRLLRADDVIRNNKREDLNSAVEKLHALYLKLASS